MVYVAPWTLVTADSEGTVMSWHLQSGEWLKTLWPLKKGDAAKDHRGSPSASPPSDFKEDTEDKEATRAATKEVLSFEAMVYHPTLKLLLLGTSEGWLVTFSTTTWKHAGTVRHGEGSHHRRPLRGG